MLLSQAQNCLTGLQPLPAVSPRSTAQQPPRLLIPEAAGGERKQLNSHCLLAALLQSRRATKLTLQGQSICWMSGCQTLMSPQPQANTGKHLRDSLNLCCTSASILCAVNAGWLMQLSSPAVTARLMLGQLV